MVRELGIIPKRSVLEALVLLPRVLEELYRHFIPHISKSEDARNCLRIVAVATALNRPVTLAEFVVLVEPNGFKYDMKSVRMAITFCEEFFARRTKEEMFAVREIGSSLDSWWSSVLCTDPTKEVPL